MRKRLLALLPAVLIAAAGCRQSDPGSLARVRGGTFVNTKSNLYGKGANIPDFYIGRREVTQREWVRVMGHNPSRFKGDDLPVESVSWYDCVEYCNRRSVLEGLEPYYLIDPSAKDTVNRSELDDMKWTVKRDPSSKGYRLPTEAEWEYAAGGGRKSGSHTYSGSDRIDAVAWYWRNSGDSVLTGFWNWPEVERNRCRTRPVASKAANELGLYDMSGNVREWCEDWYEDWRTPIGLSRVQRGGGWMGAEHCCETSDRGSFEANGKGPDQGFRVCRSG